MRGCEVLGSAHSVADGKGYCSVNIMNHSQYTEPNSEAFVADLSLQLVIFTRNSGGSRISPGGAPTLRGGGAPTYDFFSGDVDVELLAEVVPVLGLVVVDDASLLLDVPLELSEELSLEDWVSVSVSWPAWDTGNTTEGSFVVVSLELGCNVADGETLGVGVTDGASAWSGMLSVTTCHKGISKSGSVTSNVTWLLLCLVEGRLVLSMRAGMALILLTGSSLNLVCLARLSGWILVAVSETKTLGVSAGFEIFLLVGPERTEFEVSVCVAICSLSGGLLASERTEFSFELSSPQGSSERTEFDTCKKLSCMRGMSGLLGLM